MDVLKALVGQVPTLVWGALAFWVIYLFRNVITKDLIPRLTSFSAAGVEMSFVERSMSEAADSANQANLVVDKTEKKIHVQVTKKDRERVLDRARRAAPLLKGRRILWIDDDVSNNRLERDLLEAFGMRIEQVQDNVAANRALSRDKAGYDLVLSDIGRGANQPTGLDFLTNYRQKTNRLPVIFYISKVEIDEPVPLGAFGLTNRPDELVHLVLDALEREA